MSEYTLPKLDRFMLFELDAINLLLTELRWQYEQYYKRIAQAGNEDYPEEHRTYFKDRALFFINRAEHRLHSEYGIKVDAATRITYHFDIMQEIMSRSEVTTS